MSNEQKASDIQVFEGLDPVRENPGIYIGGTGREAHRQLAKEVIDNGVDEFLAGRNKKVFVDLSVSHQYTIYDEGGGIPVEINKKYGMSTLTLVLTKLHAGGKMKDGKAYGKGSIGQHGVGSSTVVALSEKFEIWTNRDKVWYYQSFSKGKPTSKLLKSKPPVAIKRGTVVRWVPDFTIMDKVKIDSKSLLSMMHLSSYLNPGITLSLLDSDKQLHEFYNPDGLKGYIKAYMEERELTPIIKPFEFSENGISAILTWADFDGSEIQSYVNTSRTIEGGTHVQGFLSAIYEALTPYKTKKIEFTQEDLSPSMIAMLNVAIKRPVYSSQTKSKLTTKDTKEEVKSRLLDSLVAYFDSNKTATNKVLARANQFNQARKAFKLSQKAITEIKSKSAKLKMVDRYLDSSTNKPEERELVIVEGLSAKGSCKDARDPAYQEVVAIRGKLMNVYKANPDKLLSNGEILLLLRVLGYEQGKTTLRVGKVILLADADEDGSHINSLVLGLLQRFVPFAIEQGRVYIVDAPLYCVQYKGGHVYGKSVADIQSKVPESYHRFIGRIKGWGEVNSDQIANIAFNENRVLRKVEALKPENETDYINLVGSADAIHRRGILGIGERI